MSRLRQPACVRKAAYPAAELYSAWRNCLLYDEHTWGAHCSISQPDSDFTRQQWKIKAQFAVDADREARSLAGAGRHRTGGSGENGRALVGGHQPGQLAADGHRPGATAGRSGSSGCQRLLVRNARRDPAPGQRRSLLRLQGAPPGASTSLDCSNRRTSGSTLESPYYRVTFNPTNGAVISLFDKELKRELVDPSAPYQLNQYLYVAGGNGSRIVMNPNGPEPKLNVTHA